MTKKRRSNFRGKVSEDARRQRRKTFSYLNLPKGIKSMEIEEDTRVVYLDFLPYEVTDKNHPDRNDEREIAREGDLWYKRPFFIHRNVGVDNETVVCPTSIGKRCPICDYRSQQLDKGIDWKEAIDNKSRRNLYVVIDTEDKNEEITIWDMAQRNFQDILNDELEIDETNDAFPDLEEGKTATIKLKWDSIGRNAYPVARDIKFEDRKPYEESILDEVPNLDEVLNVLSYEEIKNKYFEFDTEEPDEETEPVQSTRRRKDVKKDDDPKTTTRRRIEEDEDDKKEEKPRARRQAAKKDDKKEDDEESKCPHGHVYGKDWDDTKDCKDCEEWNACGDEYDNLNK